MSPSKPDAPAARVFCLLDLPQEVEAEFRARTDFEQARTPASLDELARLSASGREFDILLCGFGAPPLTAAAIRSLPPSIRMLATYSVGVEHIDLCEAQRRGLAVCNTPGSLAASVAETAMFLALGAMRRATENIALVRGGDWIGWRPTQLIGQELVDKTLGIFGMGEIGVAVAHRARAFGMRIAYTNRRLHPAAHANDRFVADSRALVRTSDVLLLGAPSTPDTRGFINAATLALAKPSLVIVNIARGDLIVDDDLIAALSSGGIYAAGLDVFNGEPDLDPRYRTLPNVFMTPHMGSSTIEARLRMARVLIAAFETHARGGTPANLVA